MTKGSPQHERRTPPRLATATDRATGRPLGTRLPTDSDPTAHTLHPARPRRRRCRKGRCGIGAPVPLKTDRITRPFPVDVFPALGGATHVSAVAEATQTPVDLAASVGTGVPVHGSRRQGARAGEPVVARAGQPVHGHRAAARVAQVAGVPGHDRAADGSRVGVAGGNRISEPRSRWPSRIAAARAEELAKKAERATANPQEALADATAAAKEAAEIVVPELPRLMTDDVTPESCVSLHGRARRPDRCPVGRRRCVRHPDRHPLLRRTQPRGVPQGPRGRQDPGRPQGPRVRVDRPARAHARSHHPAGNPSRLGRTARLP